MAPPTAKQRRSLLQAAPLIALFAGALLLFLHYAGASPIVWIDTFNDANEVRQCLVNDSCTFTGLRTSVSGQVHGVAWLELLGLLRWLGVSLDGVHLLMQVCNALALVLVFWLGTRLGGVLAGTAAAWMLVSWAAGQTVRITALYNSSPLLALGAVFLLACTAAVTRPGVVPIAVAASVAAIMANVHLACVVTGASVVWVALLAPRRRFRLAAFGGLLFVLLTVVIAPPSWLHDLRSILYDREAHGRASGMVMAQSATLLSWAIFAVVAWVASLVTRRADWVAYRRRSQGALAIIVPFVAAFLVGPIFGLRAEVKYLSHLQAACAIAAAFPIGLATRALLRRVLSPHHLPIAERVLSLTVAIMVAIEAPAKFAATRERLLRIDDLAVVLRILQDERGWDTSRILAGVKSPYGVTVQTGLWELSHGMPRSNSGVADRGATALLMVVEIDEIPQSLPPNWRIVRHWDGAAALLVFLQSAVDWSRFEVCVQPLDGAPRGCEESGLHWDEKATILSVPNMPPIGPRARGSMTLRLPIHAAGAPTYEIFMPRIPEVCGGHIATTSREGLQVGVDHRHATIVRTDPDQGSPETLELVWEIGSPDCDLGAYDGTPPFFVEGDAATVHMVEAILREREASGRGRP